MREKLFIVKTSEGMIYVVANDEPQARDKVNKENKERHFAASVTIQEIKEIGDTVSRGFTPKLIL